MEAQKSNESNIQIKQDEENDKDSQLEITYDINQETKITEESNQNNQKEEENIINDENNLTKTETEIYGESYSSSFQNFNYQTQSYEKNEETTPSIEHNEDIISKENETNIQISNNEDKPWNKVAKDPSLIQKGSELFVGNLSFDTMDSDLYDNFKECGEIVDVIFFM